MAAISASTANTPASSMRNKIMFFTASSCSEQYAFAQEVFQDNYNKEILKNLFFVRSNSSFEVNACKYKYTSDQNGVVLSREDDGVIVLKADHEFSIKVLFPNSEAVKQLFFKVICCRYGVENSRTTLQEPCPESNIVTILTRDFLKDFVDNYLEHLRNRLTNDGQKLDVGKIIDVPVKQHGNMEPTYVQVGEYVIVRTKNGLVFQSGNDWLKEMYTGLYIGNDGGIHNACSVSELRMLVNFMKEHKEKEIHAFKSPWSI